MIPVGVANSGALFGEIDAWGDAMLVAYRSANPDQARFFDCTTTADHTTESPAHGDWFYDTTLDSHFMWDQCWGWRECALSGFNVGQAFGQLVSDILHRHSASTYIVDTFGPFGTNETTSAKFYFFFCFRRWQPEIGGTSIAKGGAAIRWEWGDVNTVSGTTSSDNPPNMTVPSNGGAADVNPTIGYIQMSSTDGFNAMVKWKWKSDGTNFDIAGAPPTINKNSWTSIDGFEYMFWGYKESGKVFYTYDSRLFPPNGNIFEYNSSSPGYNVSYAFAFAGMEMGNYSHNLAGSLYASTAQGMFYQAKIGDATVTGGKVEVSTPQYWSTPYTDMFAQSEWKNVEMYFSCRPAGASANLEGIFYDLGGPDHNAPLPISSWAGGHGSINMDNMDFTVTRKELTGPFADDLMGYNADWGGDPPELTLKSYTGLGDIDMWINVRYTADPAVKNGVKIHMGISDVVDHLFCYVAFGTGGFGDCGNLDGVKYIFRCDWYPEDHNPLASDRLGFRAIGAHASFLRMYWQNSAFTASTLDDLYVGLPDRSAQSSATVYVAGCPGISGHNTSIATLKNWVVDTTTFTIDESYP